MVRKFVSHAPKNEWSEEDGQEGRGGGRNARGAMLFKTRTCRVGNNQFCSYCRFRCLFTWALVGSTLGGPLLRGTRALGLGSGPPTQSPGTPEPGPGPRTLGPRALRMAPRWGPLLRGTGSGTRAHGPGSSARLPGRAPGRRAPA